MSYTFTYTTHHTNIPLFEEAVEELLSLVVTSSEVPLRLVFFGAPKDNQVYLIQRAFIRHSIDLLWGSTPPLLSYVAQSPCQATLSVEVQAIEKSRPMLQYKEALGVRYILCEDTHAKRLYTEGIIVNPDKNSIKEQSHEVFELLGDLLEVEQMSVNTIVRQWNYIEEITREESHYQHYQLFNDARSLFYQRADWQGGYPAATGIGTATGGVMVEVDAFLPYDTTTHIVPIDNPLQVAAHRYSQQVLIGATQARQRTTPKFERAKAVAQTGSVTLYISGTAAIRGEESLTSMGIEEQTHATLENITYLMSHHNVAEHGVAMVGDLTPRLFRVYIKHRRDAEQARKIITARYPLLPVLYLLADVCRNELLIEIEGMAHN